MPTTEPAEMAPVASDCELVGEATLFASADRQHLASAPESISEDLPVASALQVRGFTVRRAAFMTRSPELPTPTITMSLIGNTAAITPLGASVLGLVNIAELFAAL